MSNEPGDVPASDDSQFLKALVALEEEIRRPASSTQSHTTHSTTKAGSEEITPSDGLSEQTLPQLDNDSMSRLARLRPALELLNCVSAQEHTASVGADDNHLEDFTLPARYEVVAQLGQGGFGIVVLAIDKHLKRQVAIKLPKPDMLLTKRMLARFLREAQHVAQLDHPNIIPVLGTDETAPLPFIVYHYCQGPTLADWLSRQSKPIACHQAVRIVLLLAEAMHHAHQRGILHRDLKPSNILLEAAAALENRHGFADGAEVMIPRITDFGISKIYNDSSADATTASLIIGTLHYMAPEQIAGRQGDVGWHSDVYSLGVILYELLTRQRPFTGETSAEILAHIHSDEVRLRRLRPDVSRDLEAIIQRALGVKVENRYASALDLAEELRCYLEGRGVKARRQSTLSRLRRWAIRQPLVATLSGLCCLLVIVASMTAMSYFKQIQSSLVASAAANRQLTLANSQVRAARDQATRFAHVLSEQLYAADMASAADALRKKDVLRYQPIIEKYLPGHTEAGLNKPAEPSGALDNDLLAQDKLRDAAWYYLWSMGHRSEKTLVSSHKPMNHLAFTKARDRLAACGADGIIRLIDPHTTSELRSWSAGQGELRSVSFSNNDDMLATLGERGSVCIWSSNSGELIHRFETNAKQAYQLLWQDDETIITTSNDPVVHIWKWRTGISEGELKMHLRGIEGLAISNDRKTLASAGDDGATHVWDLTNRQLLYSLEPSPGRLTDIAFCDSRQWLFTCDILGKSRRLTITDAPNTHSFLTDVARAAESIACSPDGLFVATGSREGVIVITRLGPDGENTKAQSEFGDAWQGHQGRVNDLQFSADGKSLWSAGQDGQLKLWSTHSPTNSRIDLLGPETAPNGSALFLSEHDNDGCIVCVNDKVSHWDPVAGTIQSLGQVPAYTQGMLVAPELHSLFINNSEHRVTAYRISNRDGAPSIEPAWSHQYPDSVALTGLAFCAQRNWLAVATEDASDPIKLFNATTGDPGPAWWKHPELNTGTRYITFSPNGRYLAASQGKRIAIWDLDAGEATFLTGHADTISALAFDGTSQTLASGSEDRCIRLWKVPSGELIKELRHHQDEVRSVIFSPDGKSLVSSSRLGQTLIWKLATLTLSLELDKQDGEVILPTTWRGKNLYRLFSHRWLTADTVIPTGAD